MLWCACTHISSRRVLLIAISAAAMVAGSALPLQIRALQFNVWLDATRVRDGLSLTANTIIESGADIVSLVEVKNLHGDFVEKIKKQLKKRNCTFYGGFTGNPLKFGLDADTAILSRYPVTEEKIIYRTRENCIVRSMIDVEGTLLAVYSVHLEYRCYSSYLPRGYNSNSQQFPGWNMIGTSRWRFYGTSRLRKLLWRKDDDEPKAMTDPKLIRQDNIASTRPEAMAHLIDDARLLEENNVPIVIMGDFNEPSTLDWTESMSHIADHNGLVYKWDTTELLRQSGFTDSYRELYPDPTTHPGFTWPAAARASGELPKKTDWIKMADERDRLDYVFYKGHQLEASDAWLVGTPVTVVKSDFVDESKIFQDRCSYSIGSPWPSDHRAVMTVFEVADTN